MRRIALGGSLGLALGLGAGAGALAHDTKAPGPAGNGTVVVQEVAVDPGAAVGATVVVPLGAYVQLTVSGAGAGEVHLHAFGLEAEAEEGQPVVLEFGAAQAGRFPVEMHVDDPLLGQREKAILFVEVRGP